MAVAEQIKTITTQEDRNVCIGIHDHYKISLLSQLKAMSFSTPFSLPLYSDMQLAAINWNHCRVMNSKKLPLFLSFTVNKHAQMNAILGGNLSSFGDLITHRSTERDTLNILVKKGDDLRKDEIISEIIHLMTVLLENSGTPSHFQYYSCLATNTDEGLIEIVDDAVTVGSIYNDRKGRSLNRE